MSELPPLIDAEVDLDGVSIVLKDPSPARPRFYWVTMLGLITVVGGVTWHQVEALPVALGVASVAVVLMVAGVRAQGPIEPTDIVLEVRRGRLTIDDREVETWGVEAAFWDCQGGVSTLVLERRDGVERVVTVRRQTHDREGVTRRQRDWIANLITRGVEPASAQDIPEGIRRLRARERA